MTGGGVISKGSMGLSPLQAAGERPSLARTAEQFGPIEIQALSGPQKYAGRRLATAWPMVPQVTHQDEADVTGMEILRRDAAGRPEGSGPSMLALVAKAVATTLLAYPRLNASLDAERGQLVLKRYIHLGFAIDTPKGLLVGVVRDCSAKPAQEIAEEINALAVQARTRGLSLAQMEGGSFTISSLGRHGGTAFTPLVNPPEVAILGLSAVQDRPMRDRTGGLAWRRMLPLSLTYDHRAINGAEAAEFVHSLKHAIATAHPEGAR